jgi:hypothetical protein
MRAVVEDMPPFCTNSLDFANPAALHQAEQAQGRRSSRSATSTRAPV